jgi:hypothetical protein
MDVSTEIQVRPDRLVDRGCLLWHGAGFRPLTALAYCSRADEGSDGWRMLPDAKFGERATFSVCWRRHRLPAKWDRRILLWTCAHPHSLRAACYPPASMIATAPAAITASGCSRVNASSSVVAAVTA